MKIVGFLILGLALSTALPVAAEEHHAPAPSADPRFEFLKRLEGTWVGTTDQEGHPEGRFEFRVTAGARSPLTRAWWPPGWSRWPAGRC